MENTCISTIQPNSSQEKEPGTTTHAGKNGGPKAHPQAAGKPRALIFSSLGRRDFTRGFRIEMGAGPGFFSSTIWPRVKIKIQIVPSVNIPIQPQNKVGSKMGGEFSNPPKWDPSGFDHHRFAHLEDPRPLAFTLAEFKGRLQEPQTSPIPTKGFPEGRPSYTPELKDPSTKP